MRVNANKFPCKNSSRIEVACIWFEWFIVGEDLARRSCWHWRNEKRVPQAFFHNFLLQCSPVITPIWCIVPEIELKFSFWSRTSFEWFIGSFFFCKGAWLGCSRIVDGFEDFAINFECFFWFERDFHFLKCISHTLDTNSNRSVLEIAIFGFWNWVVISVYDLIEIYGDDFGDF